MSSSDSRQFSYIRYNAARLVAIGLGCDIAGTLMFAVGAGGTITALGGLVVILGAIALVTGIHHVVMNHTIQTMYLQRLVSQTWVEQSPPNGRA